MPNCNVDILLIFYVYLHSHPKQVLRYLVSYPEEVSAPEQVFLKIIENESERTGESLKFPLCFKTKIATFPNFCKIREPLFLAGNLL